MAPKRKIKMPSRRQWQAICDAVSADGCKNPGPADVVMAVRAHASAYRSFVPATTRLCKEYGLGLCGEMSYNVVIRAFETRLAAERRGILPLGKLRMDGGELSVVESAGPGVDTGRPAWRRGIPEQKLPLRERSTDTGRVTGSTPNFEIFGVDFGAGADKSVPPPWAGL